MKLLSIPSMLIVDSWLSCHNFTKNLLALILKTIHISFYIELLYQLRIVEFLLNDIWNLFVLLMLSMSHDIRENDFIDTIKIFKFHCQWNKITVPKKNLLDWNLPHTKNRAVEPATKKIPKTTKHTPWSLIKNEIGGKCINFDFVVYKIC